MSVRLRLIYEKRRGACFVPHIALISMFTRAAVRAGISLRLTEGFSPHAKMSFGPELPAGVAALWEPVDIWLKCMPDSKNLVSLWNGQMPDGFAVKACVVCADDVPALGKACQAAQYWVRIENGLSPETFGEVLRSHYGRERILNFNADGLSAVSFVVSEPAQNGIGGLVRALTASELVSGWQDLRIARLALGSWDGERMRPLCQEEGIACLQTEK